MYNGFVDLIKTNIPFKEGDTIECSYTPDKERGHVEITFLKNDKPVHVHNYIIFRFRSNYKPTRAEGSHASCCDRDPCLVVCLSVFRLSVVLILHFNISSKSARPF